MVEFFILFIKYCLSFVLGATLAELYLLVPKEKNKKGLICSCIIMACVWAMILMCAFGL